MQSFRYYLYDSKKKHFFEIVGGTICGRADADLLFPHDDLLSKNHCRFTIVGNEIYIEDIGSGSKSDSSGWPGSLHHIHVECDLSFCGAGGITSRPCDDEVRFAGWRIAE